MARFPGAVTLVTARTAAGDRRGVTATAFSSVSADPPQVLVCLNRQTGTCSTIAGTGRFAVNLLTAGQGPIALRFAGQTGATGADKFTEGDWGLSPDGLPLLRTAALSLCCELSNQLQAGTHSILVGRVCGLVSGDGPALVYEQGGFRQLAPL